MPDAETMFEEVQETFADGAPTCGGEGGGSGNSSGGDSEMAKRIAEIEKANAELKKT